MKKGVSVRVRESVSESVSKASECFAMFATNALHVRSSIPSFVRLFSMRACVRGCVSACAAMFVSFST